MGEFREPNGVVLEESNPTVVVVSSSAASGSSCCVLNEEVWAQAELATEGIIRQVQPTVVSEERRKDVIDYVQRLLKLNLGCEVFPFGSVPLKTYLPDGDIDLTAFCNFNLEESFATEVHSVLEREDHNPRAKFVVKDVQYIRAEVKLVKCLVQNIVVDISFNQIGGLCALCFLEEIDRLIGKDHLFKRSIILIKAWCYYESRILGAHHGLISTYALETLVLYIFHLFHSSLTGPLAVLYKFLDYFSKFDWENYGVSLSGPVNLKSLPDIIAQIPENGGGELLLSHDFMRDCVQKFSVPSKGSEINSRTFMKKHLNIVDPLKANNNLGRSVSKGNFFRIRSAFTYGARKLGQILSQPQSKITEEVKKFFTNTLDRHGQGHRPDVQDMMAVSGFNGFVPEVLFTTTTSGEPSHDDLESIYHNGRSSEFRVVSENTRYGVSSNALEHETYLEDVKNSDAFEGDEKTKSPLGAASSGPRHHHLSNGKLENGVLHENVPSYSNSTIDGRCNNNESSLMSGGSNETPRLLPDLYGDVVSHLDSLRYGQWWYECDQFFSTFQPVHVGPPLYRRNNQWDVTGNGMPFRRDMVPCVNGVVPNPPFFAPSVVAGVNFVEEMPKPRGTGTYFPITNHHSYRDKPSQGRGRNQGQLKSPRTNGRAPTPPQSPGVGKPRCPTSYGGSPRGKVFKEVNEGVPLSDKADNFIAQGHHIPTTETPLQEGESNGPSPGPSSPPRSPNGEHVLVKDGRLGVQSYRLVDEEDFPPLSA